MPVKRSSSKLDEGLVKEGAPMLVRDPDDPGAEPGRLFLRYAGDCGPFKRARTAALERMRRRSRRGDVDYVEFTETKMPGLIAKHLATGWEGVVDDDGKEMEFSAEEVERWLVEDRDLLEDAAAFSSNRLNYRHVEERDKTVGKLRAVSGSS